MHHPAPKTHLFILAPNNSGSTLLRKYLEKSFFARYLNQEAQHTQGFVGPSSRGTGLRLLWAHSRDALSQFTDVSAYDWKKSNQAWLENSIVNSNKATVLVTSSPPFLLMLNQLDQFFPDARFILLVRDPYAIVEGIYRRRSLQPVPEADCYRAAAQHAMRCLQYQRENIQQNLENSVSFSYEDLCDHTDMVKKSIQTLVPEFLDLNFDAEVSVKGKPSAPIKNKNTEQIKRIDKNGFNTINDVFIHHQELLDSFGYSLRH